MLRKIGLLSGTAWLVLLVSSATLPAADAGKDDFWQAAGSHGAVATGGAEAADAALAMLDRGNAMDAAVAALLVLSVTESNNFCFGGEVPILVYDARRNVIEVVAGQGAAPQLATVDYYQKQPAGRIPGGGDPTTAAVPAALDACLTVLDRYGTRSFAAAAAPALEILRRPGPAWKADLAHTLDRLIDVEKTGGGDRQRGLRLVADYFYRGPIAREIDAWSRDHGGLLRSTDLATHVTRIEEPLAIEYRGYRVVKCGAWTQGPCLLESLQLLEKFDLRALGRDSPDYVHVVVEALKLALADRDTYYADPLFVDVPLAGLLSPAYANLRRPLIEIAAASPVQRPGDPLAGRALLGQTPQAYRLPAPPSHDTTTCLVADRQGNVVAATPSGWGGVLAGRTGVMLGSRLRSFNTWPGHPNCIQPGKRPRVTLTPTLVLRGGRPVAAISVAGGDLQDQVTLQLLLGYVEFGLSPAQCVTGPRFATDHCVGSFNQTPPRLASLLVNPALGRSSIDALAARGHRIHVQQQPFGSPVMLAIDPQTGRKQAAGDPKTGRHARAN
jgi:gamma-glutamyltranspeptidase/glutathione hydrolase